MQLSLPLCLKLAVASLTGMAAFVACQITKRDEILRSQISSLRNSLQNVTSPPLIFIVGFKGHGKSAFVNTACRVLNEEHGPLVFRAETGPAGPTKTTQRYEFVNVPDAQHGFRVTLVDTPALPAADKLTPDDVKGALSQIPAYGEPECVVLVIRCTVPPREKLVMMSKLPEMVTVIRERGLNLVVVLTHKNALKNMEHAEELRKNVALMAKTDCIYFIENYTANGVFNDSRPITIKNNFDTHNKTLVVIRQCVEFAALYQSDSSMKATSETPHPRPKKVVVIREGR